MVGHSCNAGAHTIEWMEEGWSAVRLPSAYYAPTIHSLSLSSSLLPPSLSFSRFLALSLSSYVHLSHYASTTALSRILEAELANSQVGSRFCRPSYVSSLLCARRESTSIPLLSITTPFVAPAALLCRFELILYNPK